jgi:hypothetical protein
MEIKSPDRVWVASKNRRIDPIFHIYDRVDGEGRVIVWFFRVNIFYLSERSFIKEGYWYDNEHCGK